MPHSSFKSAQKNLNIEKKRNFNIYYRRYNNQTALSLKDLFILVIFYKLNTV